MSSLRYAIKVSKEGADVKATWDISVDMSSTEVIGNFTLTVDGKNLDTQCSGGNKACKSAAYTALSSPDQDCTVSFVIKTNKPDSRDGKDVLRGAKKYDAVHFSS